MNKDKKQIIHDFLFFDESVLHLKNGNLEGYHDQDCCETVYADFTALDDTTFDRANTNIEDIEIEFVTNGFRINGYFVPCYNMQNGYYNDILELKLYNDRDELVINYGNVDCEYIEC